MFSIFNAEGGIFYRYGPHWNETTATPGVGVYNGDQVELLCGAFGDPIGPFNDTAWSYVNSLSRPVGKGWVNEHYINDGAPDNAFVSGEPMCPGAASSPPSSQPKIEPWQPKSVFYSPNGLSTALSGITVADDNLPESAWAPGGCNTSKAGDFPSTVNTLAGWSKGRLGPMYFLASNSSRISEIRTIILFDPGSEANMAGGCDGSLSPSINSLLVTWLNNNPANKLLILTGYDSEEHTYDVPLAHIGFGESHYHGLWNYYLKGLWSQPWSLRSRAQICDYNNPRARSGVGRFL